MSRGHGRMMTVSLMPNAMDLSVISVRDVVPGGV